jgi:predicted  nucleic acid-binding Zn-ribbon protein
VGPPFLFIQGVLMSNYISPFGALVDLVNFDSHVRTLRHSIEDLSKDIVQYKQLIEAQQTSKKNALRDVVEAKKNVDQSELNLSELHTSMQSKKKVLETLSDYKEFKFLKSELEHVGNQLHEQENIVETAWKKLETANIETERRVKVADESIKELEKSLQEKITLHQQTEHELDAYQKNRDEKAAVVPEQWLLKYNMMQARVQDPVVPIEQDSCSSCFSYVTGNNLLQAKRGALVQCTSCYRLLFLPAVMERS